MKLATSCTYFQSPQKCHANQYLGCIILSAGFPSHMQTTVSVCKLSKCCYHNDTNHRVLLYSLQI